MDLHLDGAYVKEVTEWLLMIKIDEHLEKKRVGMKHQCHILISGYIIMIYIKTQ